MTSDDSSAEATTHTRSNVREDHRAAAVDGDRFGRSGREQLQDRGGHDGWKGAWRALLLLAVAWTAVPPLAEPLGTGLDRSWAAAVQIASAERFVWGRDLMWTYGPLGAIGHPIVGIEGHAAAAAGRLVLTLAHVLAAAILIGRSSRKGLAATAGVTSALMLSGVLGIADSAILVVLAVVIVHATAGPGHRRAIAAACGAGLAALALLVKFNLGVLGAISIGVWAITEPRAGVSWAKVAGRALAVFGTGIGVLVAAWLGTGSPLGALGNYLRDGWRLAAGFSTQLALAGPGADHVFAAALVVPFALAVIVVPAGRVDRRRLLVIAPLAFGLFKAGFVRHDLHAAHWFVTAPALAAPIVAFASHRLAPAYGVASIAMVLVSGLWFALSFPPPMPWPAGARNVVDHVDAVGERSARLGATPPDAALSGRLPDKWRERIGADSVDAYPWDIAELVADGLAWRPRYVPQSYQAYHAALDRSTANGIEAAGPEYIVSQVAAVDDLHPAMVDPATWFALLDRYDLVEERGGRSLLARREQPRFRERAGVPCEPLTVGRPWTIPSAGGLPVLASIEIAPSPFGRLIGTLWRLAPPEMEVRRFDGSSTRRRITWHTLRNGALVSHLPDGPASLRPLYGPDPQPHAVSEIILHADTSLWAAVSPVRCEALVPR